MPSTQIAQLPSADIGSAAVSSRLLSVDVFRGLCVAGMILVTNPGTYDSIYWPLKHADWNGATPTDMIFPSFLFLAGVSMTFSFAARQRRGESATLSARHIVLRSLGLIVLGVCLNCMDLLTLPDLRLPGVLQRIGLCYCSGGLVYLALRGKRPPVRNGLMAATMLLLLVTYWSLQTRIPVPGYGAGRLDQADNFGAYIDRAIFGVNHLWHWGGQIWDPEGLLSTLPAIANLLLGILAGERLTRTSEPTTSLSGRSRFQSFDLALRGVAMVLLALALDPVIPINKKIWTPSFMLLSGGVSLLALALLHWLLDGQLRRWLRIAATPALVFGSNAVLGFSLANIFAPLLGLLRIPTPNGGFAAPSGFVYQRLLPWMDPRNASLAYAVLFTLFICAILWPLYQRRIFLRL